MQYDEYFDPKNVNFNGKIQGVNCKGESYSTRRDTHKVRQILEKSREGRQPEILKEITPVKFTRNYNAAKSTNGKTNPMSSNHGYSLQYAKRKNSRRSKIRNNAKYISNDQDKPAFGQRSNSASSKCKNSVNSRKSSSNNRVIDLNEIRNKEKQMKQARVGIHGTQFDKMISKTNFSKMTKNYAKNVCNLRTNEVEGPHQFYSAKDNELGSKTERSYSNLSQQNKTHNSRYQEGRESILSEERLQDIDNRSRTQQEIPNGILQLRKQMLNQEYQILEEQKKELQMTNLSPDTKEMSMQSQHDTPNNLEQESNKKSNPHNFDLNKNYP